MTASSFVAETIRPTVWNDLRSCAASRVLLCVAVALLLASSANVARAQALISLGRQAADQSMRISIVLPLRNQAALTDLIGRLYNPSDPLYGHYLEPSDFANRFGPGQGAVDAVAAFAMAHNLAIDDVSSNRTVVHLTGRTADIEAAFGVHLNAYQRADGTHFLTPDTTPTLPPALAGRMVGVFGLDTSIQPKRYSHFTPMPLGQPSQSYGLFTTGVSGMDPSDVRSIYHLPLTQTSTNGSGETLALFETDGWTPSDITTWEAQYGLPNNAPQLRSVDGGTGQPMTSGGASETTLDIDMELTLAPDATILVYDSPGVDYTQEAIDLYNAMATDDTASVISSSIGGSEQDQSLSFIMSEYQAFEQFAAQGQTMCASGGDSGAYNDQGNFPNTPTVSDPASDPYVLAVGGTFINDTSSEAYVSESSWSDTSDKSHGPRGTGGGGGISSIWTIPSYQVGAFSTSVNTQSSTTMRNIPDVSLYGDFDESGYSIYLTDPTTGTPNWYTSNGTSASSPLYASFLANVDQLRKANGLSNIGLAQTAIYSLAEKPAKYAADFHDVNDGSNNLLYVAVTGFDDSTGWGSFNGANLLADLGTFDEKNVPLFLTFNSNPVPAGTSTTGTVTLSEAAPTGGATVTIKKGTTVVTTASIAAGQISGQFPLAIAATTVPGTYKYTASYNGGSVTAPLVVKPKITIQSLTLNPTAILSGQSSLITVTLNENAPSSGVSITILLDGGLFDTMQIAGSNTGGVFIFLGGSPGAYPIEAEYGSSSKTVNLNIVTSLPTLSKVTLAKSVIAQGQTTSGTVTLAGAAPSGGAVVNLSSSNMSAATVPATVTVPAGSKSKTFTVTAAASVPGDETTSISASYNSSNASAKLTVTPPFPTVAGLALAKTTISQGQSTTGTITLSSAAPPGGSKVVLTSSNTAAATVPASVTVAQGKTTVTFTVKAAASVSSSVSTIITAGYNNSSQTATLTVNPPALSTLSISPGTVTGTTTATGTVTLTAMANPPFTVSLSSSDPSVASVPATVTVPTGSNKATFTITTIAPAERTEATITATDGTVIEQAGITVAP